MKLSIDLIVSNPKVIQRRQTCMKTRLSRILYLRHLAPANSTFPLKLSMTTYKLEYSSRHEREKRGKVRVYLESRYDLRGL